MIVEVFQSLPEFQYFKGLVEVKEGLIQLPDRPGLGIEIDEEAVKNAKPIPEVMSTRTSPPRL